MNRITRIGTGLASAAVLSLAATPALARDWGWGGYRHHDRGIDAGDVFAGVLILGGIAAIASAASKSKKDREQRRDDDYRYPDDQRDRDYGRDDNRGYDGRGTDNRPDWSESRGINDAIDRCASEVERGDRRIESVDSVNREGNGWRVTGQIDGDKDFSCTIDRDGRIRNIDIDGQMI